MATKYTKEELDNLRVSMCESKKPFSKSRPRTRDKTYLCPFCGMFHRTTMLNEQAINRPNLSFMYVCTSENDAKNRKRTIEEAGGIVNIVEYENRWWLTTLTLRERKQRLMR